MSKGNIKILIGILCLLIMVFAAAGRYVGSLEEAMDEAGLFERQILHTLEVEQGTVVFYEPGNHPDRVHVGLIKKTFLGYEWISGTDVGSFETDHPLTYGYSNIGESIKQGDPKALPIHSGVIIEDRIDHMKLEFRDGSESPPEIVETEIGRLWYFFPEWEYRELSKIYGYGEQGETVFEN